MQKSDTTKQLLSDSERKNTTRVSRRRKLLENKIDLNRAAHELSREDNNLTNAIKSSKYTKWTFLPKNLMEQFTSKLANTYFLIICVLQCFKKVSITNGKPTNLPPLAFVLLVSMIKDGYEDYKRHKSDNVINDRKARVFIS